MTKISIIQATPNLVLWSLAGDKPQIGANFIKEERRATRFAWGKNPYRIFQTFFSVDVAGVGQYSQF